MSLPSTLWPLPSCCRPEYPRPTDRTIANEVSVHARDALIFPFFRPPCLQLHDCATAPCRTRRNASTSLRLQLWPIIPSPTAGRTDANQRRKVGATTQPPRSAARCNLPLFVVVVSLSAIDFSLWFGVLPQRHLPNSPERTAAERVAAGAYSRVASSSFLLTRLVLDVASLDSV